MLISLPSGALMPVLGLVREQVFAMLLGAGDYADAFNTAFRVPNLLRDLFAEGALSSAFIPTYARELAAGGPARAHQLSSRLLTVLAVILALTMLAYIYLGDGMDNRNVTGSGFRPEYLLLSRRLNGSPSVQRFGVMSGDATLPLRPSRPIAMPSACRSSAGRSECPPNDRPARRPEYPGARRIAYAPVNGWARPSSGARPTGPRSTSWRRFRAASSVP
jgi:hypothetical protein